MHFLKRHAKRIAYDAAGYGLIIIGISLGWLPGPGGIPLILAGLGVLAVHNKWAASLRDYLLRHGGRIVKVMFPPIPLVQLLYDALAIILWVVVAILVWKRAAIWQLSLAVALFFLSIFIAAMNRERYMRFKRKRS